MLSVDPRAPWAVTNMGFGDFPTGPETFPDLSQPGSTVNFMNVPNGDLSELSKSCSSEGIRARLESVGSAGSGNMGDGELDMSPTADPLFTASMNNIAGITDPKGSLSAMPQWDINNWVTDTQMELPFQSEDMMTAGGVPFDAYSQLMYHTSGDGFPIGNSSCQTFATTSSSDGEPCLMTPPLKTSPMPTLAQEFVDRRGSNSSELAHDFNTIRLQPQARSRSALHEEVFCPPVMPDRNVSDRSSPGFPAGAVSASPPALGPENETEKVCPVPRIDLASRRKRPRPATLRPDSQRSQSYGGPLTTSPNCRMPSSGLTPSPSVRRIRSTGQNMNVMSGRIQKPGSSSVQFSPRSLQSCIDAGLRPTQLHQTENAETPSAPPSSRAPLTPLSPGRAGFKAEVWPHYPDAEPFAAGLGQPQGRPMTNSLDAGPEITSPPITPFNIDAFPQMFSSERHHPHPFYHCPQSAPSQQTTFFGDSPVVPASQSTWQVPSSTMPIDIFPTDPTLVMPNLNQMSHFGYAEVPFHPMGALPHYHGLTPVGPTRPTVLGNSPAPKKEIEFHINLIPKPQGAPQAQRKYTFNHTTPKDFAKSICA